MPKQLSFKQQLKQEFINTCKEHINDSLMAFANLPLNELKTKKGKIKKETQELVNNIKMLQLMINKLRKL